MTRSPTKSPSPADPGFLEAEVLIVGGGLVGSTLAIALAQAGVDVVVIDTQDPRAGLDAGFDGRASAIALATKRMLDSLGVWPLLEAAPAPIKDIRVSEGESLMFLHYDHREVGDEPFGYMVENRYMRQALQARIGQLERVDLVAPAQIERLEPRAWGVEAALADGRQICVYLCVAADGRRSRTREEAGIRATKWSYNQSGIVCTAVHKKSHEFTAHEHFLPAGPFAILPLNGETARHGHCSSIVWTERADIAPAIMALDDAQFLGELVQRFGDFLGDVEVVGPRWCYPLGLQFAETSVAHRLALVGDASHSMHPVAGQGLNMGLRDVAALAEVVLDARRLGLDIGSDAVLERYQRWRRFDNTLMLAATDGLNRLFSNRIRPLRLARDFGLAAVNRVPPLKRTFMRQAMGLSGEMPRLMRGKIL